MAPGLRRLETHGSPTGVTRIEDGSGDREIEAVVERQAPDPEVVSVRPPGALTLVMNSTAFVSFEIQNVVGADPEPTATLPKLSDLGVAVTEPMLPFPATAVDGAARTSDIATDANTRPRTLDPIVHPPSRAAREPPVATRDGIVRRDHPPGIG